MWRETRMNTNIEQGVIAQAEVDRLKGLVRSLAVNARVRLHMRDGCTVCGIVSVTPTVQMVRNANGDESVGGTVKLEDPVQPGWDGLVHLVDIVSVEHLDSVTMGVNKA
jgi:hypothetical protein